MLQVIKAEDVRDGEPRWYCPDAENATYFASTLALEELHVTDRGSEWFANFPLAIVDRPAPPAAQHDDPPLRHVAIWLCVPCIKGEGSECHSPGCALFLHRVDLPIHEENLTDIPAPSDQPPPVLDLDELERAIWSVEHAAEVRSGVTRSCNALRAALRPVIAEARAAVALRQELAEEQESRARLDEHFKAVCQQRDTTSLLNEAIRRKLAEAKRLGLDACTAWCRIVGSDGDDDGIAAVEKIAAELEAL